MRKGASSNSVKLLNYLPAPAPACTPRPYAHRARETLATLARDSMRECRVRLTPNACRTKPEGDRLCGQHAEGARVQRPLEHAPELGSAMRARATSQLSPLGMSDPANEGRRAEQLANARHRRGIDLADRSRSSSRSISAQSRPTSRTGSAAGQIGDEQIYEGETGNIARRASPPHERASRPACRAIVPLRVHRPNAAADAESTEVW
jgi:hypothetical protein